MPIGVNLRLYDASGSPLASQSGIQALWWDVTEPKDASRPVGKSSVVTTDSNGYIALDLSNVTGLAVGDYGFLTLYKLDGTNHQDSPTFSGKVQTSNISSGVDMYFYDSGWTRPSGWLTFTAPSTSDQACIGLHQVFEDSNFLALSAEGDYTIDWGNGSGASNVASGVAAERNLVYSEYAGNTDAGIQFEEACTFTDAGDTVNLTGHTYKNGEKVAFSAITSTAGISTYTNYFVVGAAANTFQVATTIGGSALTLTNNGSGKVYRPLFRQAIITVAMQGGQNLTKLTLHLKHTQSGLQAYSSGFIDLAISGQYLTDLRLGVDTPGSMTQTINFNQLKKINIVRSNLKQCEQLFYNSRRLQQITDIATSTDAASTASVTFTDAGDTVNHTAHGRINGESVIFSAITSTTGITVGTRYFIVNRTANTYQVAITYGGAAVALTTNGSGTAVYGTNFASMFYSCTSLQSVPLLNTSAGTNFNNMFYSCTSLQSVPLLNTSAGTNFNNMFSSCYSLQSVPLLNTSAGTNFNNMFSSCYSLQSVPLLNTSAGTNFASMFYSCTSLQSVPLLNTSAGTNFTNMFGYCYSLQSVPLLNTSAGTNFNSMFYSCTSLQSVPLLNTSAGTNFNSMFGYCSSLQQARLAGTKESISYAGCKLSPAALDDIYTGLATVTGKTITVTDNWGVASDNPSIATAKGWTVAG